MDKKDIIEKTAVEAGISKVKAEKLVNGIAGVLLHDLLNLKGKITTRYSWPKFSIDKLAEYMTSRPSRRQIIVKNQKEKRALFVEYHKDARRVISNFISSNINEEEYWNEFYNIKNKTIRTDISEAKQNICLSALEEFEKIMYDVKFSQYRKKLGGIEQKKIYLHRIRIEAHPEILLCNDDGLVKGAVKLIFNNDRKREKIENEYLSTILLQYMKLLYDINIKNTDCYIIDIFNSAVETAPMSYKKIMLDIKASCEEIKDTWKRV
jgi:hypothetical protein